VVNNGDLNMVTWEQRATAGDAKQPDTQNLPPMDYAAWARTLGLQGIRVERPEEVGPAWDRALAARGPVVLDAVCDPEVPLMPPRVTGEHARNVAGAVLHGDEGAARFVSQTVKEKAREVLGRGGS
jgi:pyruvate dehydrogenase (quinone)